jgi:hypothetical protein
MPTQDTFRLPRRCVKCKEFMHSIMFFCLMAHFGAKCSPDPMACRKGGEHSFYYKRDRQGRFVKCTSAAT